MEADDRLGWASGPPGTNSQGVSCRGSVPAPPTGATARLRPGFEPGRGGLELAQERGDEEPLLSGHRSPQNRTPESKGAASPQDPDHQELFPGGRISLNTFSRIGKSADSRLPLANWPPFPVARGDGFSVARCTGQRGRHESAGGEAGRRKPSRSRDDIARDNSLRSLLYVLLSVPSHGLEACDVRHLVEVIVVLRLSCRVRNPHDHTFKRLATLKFRIWE